jgi:hypothetical protein
MRLEHYELSVFAQAAAGDGADLHIHQLILRAGDVGKPHAT